MFCLVNRFNILVEHACPVSGEIIFVVYRHKAESHQTSGVFFWKPAKMIGGGDPIYLKFSVKLTAFAVSRCWILGECTDMVVVLLVKVLVTVPEYNF